MTNLQLDDQGRLRHLLDVAGLPLAATLQLLDRAEAIERASGQGGLASALSASIVATLFFEPSTRTRCSFHIAASKLGATVIDIQPSQSSATKGECLIDTVANLHAMGCEAFVLRHSKNRIAAEMAAHFGFDLAIINAGDGTNAHPTQALLDAYTIRQRFGTDFSQLKILIIGDIAHSRVARSNIALLTQLGMGEIRVCGPENLLPRDLTANGTHACSRLEEALSDVDIVMALRLQKERMHAANIPDHAWYFSKYGLTEEKLRLAKPGAIVMHPGPMNRGVEIDSALADGPRSLILEQARNGVFVRMAVMQALLASHRP